jgi:hypothetical protein
MKLIGLPAFTAIAMVCLGVQAEAQTSCPEPFRLRNAASDAMKRAMQSAPAERCGAFHTASMATEATLLYANSCHVSEPLLHQAEGYHRDAVQARKNACAGRPLRPYPAESWAR